MTEEQKDEGKKLCVVCQKEEVFSRGDFDKCFTCAIAYSDQTLKEFVATLSPEQFALFEVYNKANSDVTSMFILD